MKSFFAIIIFYFLYTLYISFYLFFLVVEKNYLISILSLSSWTLLICFKNLIKDDKVLKDLKDSGI